MNSRPPVAENMKEMIAGRHPRSEELSLAVTAIESACHDYSVEITQQTAFALIKAHQHATSLYNAIWRDELREESIIRAEANLKAPTKLQHDPIDQSILDEFYGKRRAKKKRIVYNKNDRLRALQRDRIAARLKAKHTL